MNLNDLLKEEHKAFSGITHVLIATFLFLCMWMIPWQFATDYISAINENKSFALLIFLIIAGSSLLPDLDSSPLQEGGSTAVYQLGVLGYALSIVAITLSQIVWSLSHTRYDEKPKSQHRMLWHSLVIPLLIYLYVKFAMPSGGSRLWDHRDNIEYYSMFILLFFASISVYLGSSIFLYRIFKLANKQSKTQFACLTIMVGSIIYMLFTDYSNLVLIGEAISLGYAFHIFGDLLTKGSSPVLFPIPTRKNGHLIMWRKPYILGHTLAITTGGALNIILNFVLMGVNFMLVWVIFIK